MDDDDSDFTINSSNRSRLSSLFQTERKREDVNDALKFTAPKQPKKNETAQNSGTFKLLHAAAVHAYKLLDGRFVTQGKLGCAILGIHKSASYKILLYKGKQVQVTYCNISSSFRFQVQPENYANFYDEHNENWSINFDSVAELTEFAKQVALAKANSAGLSSLVVQDLLPGQGPGLESGDSADVRYTSWPIVERGFGQVFESNHQSESPLRIRLGRSQVNKGWSEGLVGAQRNGRRLLVVPAAMAGGGTVPPVPPDAAVLFEVLVTKVRVSRASSHSPSPSVSAEPPPAPATPRSSFSQESAQSSDRIAQKSHALLDAMSARRSNPREEIVSRMARLGSATLPFAGGAIPARPDSGSEEEEEEQQQTQNEDVPPGSASGSSRTGSPRSLPETSHQNTQVVAVKQESAPFQVNPYSSQTSLYSHPSYPIQQAPMPTFAPFVGGGGGLSDAHLALLTSEVRSQGTEVRLSLAKIVEKVDSVAQALDQLRSAGSPQRSPSAGVLDGAAVAAAIDSTLKENNTLKQEVEGKNSTIEALNKKIYDLVDRNQRFFEEQTSILEQRRNNMQAVSTQSQEKIYSLESEKEKLSSELSAARVRLSALEAELLLASSTPEVRSEVAVDSQLDSKHVEESQRKLENDLHDLQKKFDELHDSHAELSERKARTDAHVEELRAQSERITGERDALLAAKQRLEGEHESFCEKTRLLKEKYKDRIRELTGELQAARAAPATPDLSTQLKKAMNALYKLLQGSFDPSESYEGSKVLEKALLSIKALTFQMLERKNEVSHCSQQGDSGVPSVVETLSATPPERTGVGDTPEEKDIHVASDVEATKSDESASQDDAGGKLSAQYINDDAKIEINSTESKNSSPDLPSSNGHPAESTAEDLA